MIPRAACSALALLAGALASLPAAAQLPSPEPRASPSLQEPAPALQEPAPSLQVPAPSLQEPAPSLQPLSPSLLGPPPPPGYVPWPLIFRDGAWRPVGGFADVEPPPPSGRDPLYPTGITLGIGGLLTTALGIGLLARAGASHEVCGLSGCIGLPDREAQNYAAGLIAAGATSATFGGALAYFGGKGPPSARTSGARTVIGATLTTIGVSVAASGLVNAATPYTERATLQGEVLPPNEVGQLPHSGGATVIFTLVSATFLAVGLPLWITGASSPSRRLRPYEATNRLDLLPSAGGAALRWTR